MDIGEFTLVELLKDVKGDPAPRLKRAADAMKREDYAEAAELFETLLGAQHSDDTHAAAYQGLGYCQIKNREFENAAASLEKARGMKPRNKMVRNNLGWAYFKLGMLDEAEAEMRATCELDPEFPQPVHNLGWVFYNREQYAYATAVMQKAIEMKEVPTWHRHLAFIYEKAGNKAAAEMHRVRYRALTTEPDLTLEDEVAPGVGPAPMAVVKLSDLRENCYNSVLSDPVGDKKGKAVVGIIVRSMLESGEAGFGRVEGDGTLWQTFPDRMDKATQDLQRACAERYSSVMQGHSKGISMEALSREVRDYIVEQ